MLIKIIAELQRLVVEISCIVSILLYSYLRVRARSPRSVATVDLRGCRIITNFGKCVAAGSKLRQRRFARAAQNRASGV